MSKNSKFETKRHRPVSPSSSLLSTQLETPEMMQRQKGELWNVVRSRRGGLGPLDWGDPHSGRVYHVTPVNRRAHQTWHFLTPNLEQKVAQARSLSSLEQTGATLAPPAREVSRSPSIDHQPGYVGSFPAGPEAPLFTERQLCVWQLLLQWSHHNRWPSWVVLLSPWTHNSLPQPRHTEWPGDTSKGIPATVSAMPGNLFQPMGLSTPTSHWEILGIQAWRNPFHLSGSTSTFSGKPHQHQLIKQIERTP